MTKTPIPFNVFKTHKTRCVAAARAWANAFPSDPFAFGHMFHDLYNRLNTWGDIEEVMTKANALIKAREDAKSDISIS